jgi:hypothetical protein
MSVQLSEIVKAVTSYTQNKITRKVKGISPTTGVTINPGEKFIFAIEVANASEADGGVALSKVVYHVQIGDPAKAALLVPPASVGIAMTAPINGQQLSPGDVVGHYFLFTPFTHSHLSPGEVVVLDNLEGVAKTAGNTAVGLSIAYEVATLMGHQTGVTTGGVAIV